MAGTANGEEDEQQTVRRRDPDRARASILVAATAEFAALGFGSARVDAIAAQAGVNKRMLYHYFGNKDDLYLAVLEEAYAAIRAAESELVLRHGNPANAMRKLVLFTCLYYREHPEFISLLATENINQGAALGTSLKIRDLNSPLIETIRSLLEQGAAEGAPLIESYMIRVTERAFDDFAASGTDRTANRKILGL